MARARAYYNENDPFNAEWLRKLIEARVIMDGDVDDRSILDVRAADLIGYQQHHFFAGIGGWAYAAKLANWPVGLPLWTGSCPCQPFSAAVRIEKKGFDDERHLWPAFYRLIQEFRPAIVAGEQVASPDGLLWLDGVFVDLEDASYAVAAVDLCAAGVGAPHIRQRLYWVGDSEFEGLERHTGDGYEGRESNSVGPDPEAGRGGVKSASVDAMPVLRRLPLRDSRRAHGGLPLPPDRGMGPRSVWAEFDALACADGWRTVRPGSFPMADGIPARVERLHAYGNAIVPQVGALFLGAYLDTRSRPNPTLVDPDLVLL